jgi:hypothetical protein
MRLKSIKLIVFLLLVQNIPVESIQARYTTRSDCQLPVEPLDSYILSTSMGQKFIVAASLLQELKQLQLKLEPGIISSDYLVGTLQCK